VGPEARIRLTIQMVLLLWATFALAPLGADWLSAIGVGEWTAAWLAAAAPPAALLFGTLYWLLAGRPRGGRTLLADGVAAPSLVLGMTGLVSGTASRGHLFVAIFLSVPAVIVLLVAGVRLRAAGNRGRHPDVVEVTTDSGGMS
jgi:hypothetical protein